MKIAVIENENIKIKETEDIRLNGRKGAVVKILGCGLCGSDIIKLIQKLSPNGTVLGHEIVARIMEIDSETNFKTGDTIVTSHHIPCGGCAYCKNGNISMCKHFKETNLEPGGFSELVYLSEEHLQNVAYLKPENLTNEEASFYEPLGCCVRSIRRAGLKKGSSALVIGLGSIGIIMAQALEAYGIKAIGCDLIQERVDILKKIGLEARQTFNEKLNVDAVFMTSGSDRAIETALVQIRDGGTIVVFASTPNNFGYPNNEIYYRELTVIGSYSPAPEDLKDALELLKSGKVNTAGLSTTYEFDEINNAFSDTISNKALKAYIRIEK